MNRAIARRTFFERPPDLDCFQELLASAVAEGWLEVHSYSFLPTHFHLLVRSPVARLSWALRHVQLGYVRWFNRSRKRDGPLVRQRFRSRPVECLGYRCVLVGYIDANAPDARLTLDATSYPYASAFHYARASGPTWLERSWVEEVVCLELGLARYDPQRYADVFWRGFQQGHRSVVETTVDRRADGLHAIDLLGAAGPEVTDWMRRKAALADGTRPGSTVVAPEFIDQAIEEARHELGGWSQRARRAQRDGWMTLRALLLRHLAGSRFVEIASHLGCGRECARTLHRDAVRAIDDDAVFVARARAVSRRAIDLCYSIGTRARARRR